MNAPAVRPVEPHAAAPAARPAGLGLQPPGDDAARVRADPAAELADRLPCQVAFPKRGRLRHLRPGRATASSRCATRRARSARFHNVCRHRGARLLDGSRQLPRRASPAPITAGPTARRRAARPCRRARASPASIAAQHGLEAGAHRDHVRLRVRMPRRGDAAAAGSRSGRRCWRSSRRIASRTWCPLGPVYHRALGRGLEDRDGQLPRVLSRAHRPSGPVPHVHARLRGPARNSRRRARYQLDARASLLALERADVPAARRPRSPSRTCPSRTAAAGASTAAAEPRHRRLARADGLLSGAAAWSGQVHRSAARPSAAGRAARDAHRTLARQPHQQAGEQRRTDALCERVQRGLGSTVPTARARCRSSRPGCSSSTICCGRAFPRCACPRRRRASPRSAAGRILQRVQYRGHPRAELRERCGDRAGLGRVVVRRDAARPGWTRPARPAPSAMRAPMPRLPSRAPPAVRAELETAQAAAARRSSAAPAGWSRPSARLSSS